MNIMLVEDDATDRKLLSAVLRTGGHRIVEQVSAEEAFVAIKASPPEVILIDLKLPGMDGLELARRLKADPETALIPVVAMTAATERFSREAALRAGCDAYITKPVDTRKLTGQVTGVVKK